MSGRRRSFRRSVDADEKKCTRSTSVVILLMRRDGRLSGTQRACRPGEDHLGRRRQTGSLLGNALPYRIHDPGA
jgi:hypothetical protein